MVVAAKIALCHKIVNKFIKYKDITLLAATDALTLALRKRLSAYVTSKINTRLRRVSIHSVAIRYFVLGIDRWGCALSALGCHAFCLRLQFNQYPRITINDFQYLHFEKNHLEYYFHCHFE